MKNNGIIKLHCHTKMSKGLGLLSPAELIRYAYDNGFKAIAITDRGNVQAFPEAYREWTKLWEEYKEECLHDGKEAVQNDFLKVIYGLESNLLIGSDEIHPVLLYAKNEIGIRNLYKIVTASNLQYYDKMPLIPKGYLDEHREGIIVGSIYADQEVIANQIDYVKPLREGKYHPVYPNADEELMRICEERVKNLYGDNPNCEVRNRLERELDAIRSNGYAYIFMMWRRLVKKSLDSGYPTGVRGSAGSSFVAFLCGITDINPLSAECGGYNIPIEVFMGLNIDREPDININFGYGISDTIQQHVRELPGVGEICHGGTIAKMTRQSAKGYIEKYYEDNSLPMANNEELKQLIEKSCDVKRGNGIHPGGIIICPEGEELTSFTPLTHPYFGKSVTTEFDYHDIADNLLRLDILGHSAYDMLHALQKMTSVSIESIPPEDEKVLAFICDTDKKEIKDLPEFGSEFTRSIIAIARPKTFDDLVKVSAISHGSEVWYENQKELVENGEIALSDCIGSRDDIMIHLMNMFISKEDAYDIMNSVRKGKGLTDEQELIMTDAGIPEWYISACKKIRYLFPKAHSVSYTMLAVRTAFYMVYYPNAFAESLTESR